MLCQELLDHLRFVCRQIVEYDVNLPCPFRFSDQLRQKSHEFGAGVPPRGFPLHLSGLHVQRRI